MPTWLNKATLYTFAWCLYWTQGAILPVGSIVSQLLVFLLLFVSVYYVFVANVRYKLPIYFIGLNALLGMFSVYGLFLMLNYEPLDYTIPVQRFNYLKEIYTSLLPVYSYYVFSKENLLNEKNLKWIIILFFGTVTIMFFHDYQRQLIQAMLRHSSTEEFTNNIGYYFLALIPACVYLYKTPLLQYIALGYCVFFMIMGMKRGAILIGLLCLLWLMWNNLKKADIKLKFGLVFLSIALCISGYFFVQKQLNESIYFQKRIEETLEGNSSGRDNLYGYFANYFWNETSPIQFLFGSGAYATIKASRVYAHNDWLEIAINQGVLGLLFYLFYWIIYAKTVLYRNYPSIVKLALQLLFVIYFMQTFFSMSYGAMPFSATFILGYSLAQEKKDE